MGPKYSILHKAFCEMAKICNLKKNLKQIISQFKSKTHLEAKYFGARELQ